MTDVLAGVQGQTPFARFALTGQVILARTASALAISGMFALVVAVLIAVVDIGLRNIGAGSFVGIIDLTQLAVVAAAAWAIPYAFVRKAHVSMDLLDSAFSPRVTRVLDCGSSALQALALVVVIYLSWHRAIENWQYGDTSQELGIPLAMHWALILSGLVLSAAICLADLAVAATRGEGD